MGVINVLLPRQPFLTPEHNVVDQKTTELLALLKVKWLPIIKYDFIDVVRSLQVMCTTTNILTNPALLQKQIEASVKDQDNIENE